MNYNLSSNIKKLTPFIIFIWSFTINICGSGSYPIYFYDEAKNSACAREMLENNEWIVPTYNYELRTDKPPLTYYFIITAFKIFGINAFAARFFSALMGALTVLITYLFCLRHTTFHKALITVLILLGSFHLGLQFHLAVPDPYLIFFTVAALFLFIDGFFRQKQKPILFAYLSIGLGILAKGPVALVLPALSMTFFLILKKKFTLETIKFLMPFKGLILVLLVALPWFILVDVKTGSEWTRGFFIHHNFERFTSTMEGNGGSFLLTILYLFAGLFPFAVFLIQAVIHNLRHKKDDFTLFALCTASVITLFFIFSKTRLPNYTVPSYPFYALIIAQYLTYSPKFKIRKAIPLILFAILFLALFFLPKSEVPNNVYYSTIMPYGYVLWGITAGFTVALFFVGRKNIWPVLILSAGSMVSIFLVTSRVFPDMLTNNSVVKSRTLLENSEKIYYWEKFNVAYPFLVRKKIERIESCNEFRCFFENNPGIPVITTQGNLRKVNEIDTSQFEVIFSGNDLFNPDTTLILVSR